MFLLFPIFALLDLSFTLLCVLFINWWAPIFAQPGVDYNRGVEYGGMRLPNWLAWVDTFDADLDAGLATGEVATYWTRVRWLYRNPGYGFGYWLLGATFDPIQWRVKSYRDDGDLTFFAVGPGGRFNLHVTRFGIRLKLGWKAWNNFEADTGTWNDQPWGPESRIPLTASISIAK